MDYVGCVPVVAMGRITDRILFLNQDLSLKLSKCLKPYLLLVSVLKYC